GVVDHRLVVHGQQLLADPARDRVQAGAGTAGQDDALALRHGVLPPPSGRGADAFEPVAAVQHPLHPVLVGQVPVHGGRDAFLEGVARLPAQLVADLGRVDGVAAIVPGPVGDEGDQALVRAAVRTRPALVQQAADGAHHLDVAALGVAADVVGLPHPAL